MLEANSSSPSSRDASWGYTCLAFTPSRVCGSGIDNKFEMGFPTTTCESMPESWQYAALVCTTRKGGDAFTTILIGRQRDHCENRT
jgi:hypothetical protein